MIGKRYKRDGRLIAHSTDDYRIGLTMVNWRILDTTDETRNIEGSHGILMSPTYSRGRKIDIEGVIIADSRENTSKAMDWLDNQFALQAVITDSPETKEFTVVDEQDREWSISCKIKEPIEYTTQDDDHMDGCIRYFRVVLQSSDARFFSTEEQEVVGIEGVLGGWKLGVKLGKAMNEKYNAITCYPTGNFGTPCKIVITTQMEINAPLKIRWSSGHFYINSDFTAGDVIVIDAESKTITKNGTNITETRISGSNWPTIKGETTFVIDDKDSGLYASDFDVKIYFSNILM